ncbi:PadR family transcriptional regulator [Compostimonas suwonensis]|uniref:PadR family transcriptional regulator n=1 Tax=Compostimonas suwonensis TaxID=1048394 RepID=A0A2M9BZ01_9MICO|nr:PadR family transcriptional regulator [Compostimonas suwonensis]PJJ63309.1 PadR family transcriptional regulator [Compostimonas suwonensis]
MSVRNGLLAVLTLGTAYGFQLHSELVSRAPHRRSVNVGQIYGTLERVVASGHARIAGTTDDGLPLYELTDAGRRDVETWLDGAVTDKTSGWDEMLDRVLIASSLPGARPQESIERYLGYWSLVAPDQNGVDAELTVQDRLAGLAVTRNARAAVAWLTAAREQLDAEPGAARGLSDIRPRRGRRPVA